MWPAAAKAARPAGAWAICEPLAVGYPPSDAPMSRSRLAPTERVIRWVLGRWLWVTRDRASCV